MKMRSEKGSITVYVLVAMLFLVAVIAGRYALANRNLQAQYEALSKVKSAYTNSKIYVKNGTASDFTKLTPSNVLKVDLYNGETDKVGPATYSLTSADAYKDKAATNTYYISFEKVKDEFKRYRNIDLEFDKIEAKYTRKMGLTYSDARDASYIEIDGKIYIAVDNLESNTTNLYIKTIDGQGSGGEEETEDPGTFDREPVYVFNGNDFKFFAKQEAGYKYVYQVNIYYTFEEATLNSMNATMKDRTILINKDVDKYKLYSDITIKLSDYGCSTKNAFISNYSEFLSKVDFNNHIIYVTSDGKPNNNSNKSYIFYNNGVKASNY